MSECPYCQNTFEMEETCSDEFRMWQGLVGPYYIPSVDAIGNLSWTNTGDLPNPDPINITGKGLTIVGIVDDVSDLPSSAQDFDAYLVGEDDPYNAYMWDGTSWVDLGPVGRGPQGPQGPAGPQVDPATSLPIMDGTAAVGVSDKYAREDHVHPTDTSRASQTEVDEVKTNIIQSSAYAVTGNGTTSHSLTGLTADHVVGNWGMFSDSGLTTPIPENAPTCDIEITTGSGSWSITIANFTASFYIAPTFIKD